MVVVGLRGGVGPAPLKGAHKVSTLLCLLLQRSTPSRVEDEGLGLQTWPMVAVASCQRSTSEPGPDSTWLTGSRLYGVRELIALDFVQSAAGASSMSNRRERGDGGRGWFSVSFLVSGFRTFVVSDCKTAPDAWELCCRKGD